jgi:hypothetical protein
MASCRFPSFLFLSRDTTGVIRLEYDCILNGVLAGDRFHKDNPEKSIDKVQLLQCYSKDGIDKQVRNTSSHDIEVLQHIFH